MDAISAVLAGVGTRNYWLSGSSETPEPYECPECHEVKPFQAQPIGEPPVRWIIRRDLCSCEQEQCEQKEADRLERDRIAHARALFARSRLTGKLRNSTFKSHEWSEGQMEMVKAGRRFALNALEKQQGFIFAGQNGCGKSAIMAATVRACCAKLVAAEFWPTVDLTDHLARLMFVERGDHPADRFARLPVLALDDLGQEKLTDRGHDTLFKIVNDRENMERPILATTNRTVDEFEAHLGREIASRLLGSCQWIEVPHTVKDYRVEG